MNVHAWNVTNLKDVLDGAKPKLEKVDVALTHVEEGSDLKWLDGGEAYEFVFEDQVDFVRADLMAGNLEEAAPGPQESPAERAARERREDI